VSDNSNNIAISAGNLTIRRPIQNYTINFHNDTGVIGKLDFNGPQMKFEGNADESVDAFVRAFGHWFDKRLKQERESEREACAKFVENWSYPKECAGCDQPTPQQYAQAIRARGEV
jgi:hypothetical protein